MTPRIASLPMYDADRAAVDEWWRAIACELHASGLDAVPASLEWPVNLPDHWRDPQLLLSQTCGYPLMTHLLNHVQVVGAFRYSAPGCDGISYRSELVARADDSADIDGFRGRVAAINSLDSHSGSNAFRGCVAPLARHGRFFDKFVVSGSHRQSLAAVRSGVADLAAIDCITLAGLRRQSADTLSGLRVIGHTASAPGLPLVTSARTSAADLARLRSALSGVCQLSTLHALREALFIDGFEPVPASAWQAINDVRRVASSVDWCEPA